MTGPADAAGPEDGIRVPASFYEPFVPPRAAPHARWAIALGVVVAALTVLGMVGAGLAVWLGGREAADERKRAAAQEAAVERAIAAAFDRPPDTEGTRAARDGSKPWASAGPAEGTATYRVTLPQGWDARRIAVRHDDSIWVDTVLTRLGTSTDVVVRRVRLGGAVSAPAVAAGLREGLTDERSRVVSEYTETTVGGGGQRAYYYDLDTVDPRGDRYLARVLLFQYGSEQFRLDFSAAPADWDRMLEEFTRIVRSWRWE